MYLFGIICLVSLCRSDCVFYTNSLHQSCCLITLYLSVYNIFITADLSLFSVNARKERIVAQQLIPEITFGLRCYQSIIFNDEETPTTYTQTRVRTLSLTDDD